MIQHPSKKLVLSTLLAAAALFMALLGTIASAYYVPTLALAIAAALVWTGWVPAALTALLTLNHATALILLLTVFFRHAFQPAETFTLDLAGLALIGNFVAGGPLLTALSIPLLRDRLRETALPIWFARLSA